MSTTLAISDPWREELTPRSRASRRRWTAVEAGLLLLVGLTALSDRVHDGLSGGGNGRSTVLAIVMLVVFGVLRRGTRRLGALRSGDAGLDERDLASRHRAFRTAFGLFLVVLLVTLYCLPGALPDARTTGPGGSGTLAGGSYLTGGDVTVLALWLFAWALFLPTAALAWSEPDTPPLDDEDLAPVLGEGARDLLLAGTLVLGGVFAALAPEGDATLQSLVLPVLPIVVLVCVLAAMRGRRGGDGPVRAALRGWRVLVMTGFVTLCLVGFGFSGSASRSAEAYLAASLPDDVTVEDLPTTPGVHVVRVVEKKDSEGRTTAPYRCAIVISRGGDLLGSVRSRREARRLHEHPSVDFCDF